jgi:glycosyltransferase involved in cell wall biosynthesis
LNNISVIIPALNEADEIEGAIRSARGNRAQTGAQGERDIEIIVVDGGSTDKTFVKAKELGAKVLASPSGRGAQMDLGAKESKGDTMEDPLISAGAFTLAINAGGWRFRLLEFFSRLRAKHLGLIYGDQAIFTRRENFNDIGGFKKLPLFEDVDCVMKLRDKGEVLILDEEVMTSPRRWIKNGIVRNTLRNWFLLSLYMLGFNTSGLYRRYYKNPLAR